MRQKSGSRQTVEAFFVALLFGVVGVGGVVYGSRTKLPELASRHGAGIDSMLNYLLVTVGGIFLFGFLLLGWLIWAGSRRDRIGPRFAARRTEILLSASLGLAMAIVAEGGVLAIGMPVWAEYFEAEAPPDAIDVEVTAQQFMWNVRYPGPDGQFGRTKATLIDDTTNPIGLDPTDPTGKDDVITLNDITVPVDRPVHVRLRSKDVIHSFFLPHQRVKQDAVPGMTPEVVFTPTKVGSYELLCAELCGLAHYRMRGFFNVVSDAQFLEWLRLQSAPQRR
jgi:cytochrome c oxidase subunit 2